MCGRFTLTIAERRLIAEMLGVDPQSIPEDYRPRYNIAPSDPHFIVTSKYEQRRATGARWGLVNSWARDNSRAAAAINAKAETIDTRGAFRDAFAQRRCVVPADGFYEWTGGKKARDGRYVPPQVRRSHSHSVRRSLRIVVSAKESCLRQSPAPNGVIVVIHYRLPVVLDDRGADDWMNLLERDPLSLKRLLIPAPADVLVASPASPLVNSVKNDGPELLAAPPMDLL